MMSLRGARTEPFDRLRINSASGMAQCEFEKWEEVLFKMARSLQVET